MRFEHQESRYSRYGRISKAQRGRLVIYVVLLVGVLVAMYALREQSWLSSFEKAQARAKATGKPIMAFFYVEENAECRRMEKETLANKAVRAEARKFVCVRLDGKTHPALAERYIMVDVYPSVAFISPDGELVRTVLNRRSPEEFLVEMRAALQPREPTDVPPEQPTPADQTEPGELDEDPTLPPKNAEPSRGDAE